jgi:predicted short-subunit dehydrogenase-like oxidoreductase (DUF2520 family)
MDVVIVGPGRLGRTLAGLLPRAGHAVTLRGRGDPLDDGPVRRAAVVLLTVPDAAIGRVADRVPPGPVRLHTSGATDLAPLARRPGHGSLHPLMTFPGPEVAVPDLRGVPAAVDGDEAGLRMATFLARELGLRAVPVPGDRRLYHAAAVLAGNGATLLLHEARRALEAAGVAPEQAVGLLLPLVRRSVENADPDPLAALTGPVARGDDAVLAAHRRALEAAGLHDAARLHETLEVTARRALAGPGTDDDSL